jgi:phage internal scaffolding protein
MNFIIQAQEDFALLPANVRKRFNNDPGEFFEFATNPDNYDDMVKLGLANPKRGEGDTSPSDTSQEVQLNAE